MQTKLYAVLLTLLILSGCTPVDTPNAVMFSTQNDKIETPQQVSLNRL